MPWPKYSPGDTVKVTFHVENWDEAALSALGKRADYDKAKVKVSKEDPGAFLLFHDEKKIGRDHETFDFFVKLKPDAEGGKYKVETFFAAAGGDPSKEILDGVTMFEVE